MKRTRITRITVLLALMAVSACNLQVAAPVTGDVVGTAIAQTLDARTALANALAGTLSAMVTDTPIFTPVPSDTPLPTLTATLAVPMVSVSLATNCRTGPGSAYDMIGALPVGKTAEVVGKDAYGQYWIIKNPNNPGTCWLWGQYATVMGDTSRLPVIAAPPTPTPIPTPTPKIQPVVTNVTITFPQSVIHSSDCSAHHHWTVTITTNGPTTVIWQVQRYKNGILTFSWGMTTTVFAAAGTQTFNNSILDHECNTFIYKVVIFSPNSMSSQFTLKVVSP